MFSALSLNLWNLALLLLIGCVRNSQNLLSPRGIFSSKRRKRGKGARNHETLSALSGRKLWAWPLCGMVSYTRHFAWGGHWDRPRSAAPPWRSSADCPAWPCRAVARTPRPEALFIAGVLAPPHPAPSALNWTSDKPQPAEPSLSPPACPRPSEGNKVSPAQRLSRPLRPLFIFRSPAPSSSVRRIPAPIQYIPHQPSNPAWRRPGWSLGVCCSGRGESCSLAHAAPRPPTACPCHPRPAPQFECQPLDAPSSVRPATTATMAPSRPAGWWRRHGAIPVSMLLSAPAPSVRPPLSDGAAQGLICICSLIRVSV